jgi:DegV family protein with EDD domain
VRVVDTRSVAVGHYAVVREAVRVVEAGGDADAVVAAITAVQSTSRVLFTVETLEFLRRGGRIGGARALLGSMLDIKPVLEIREGAIEPVARVRTYPKAIDRVVDEFSRAATDWGGAALIVAHADRPKIAAALVERMRSQAAGTPALTVVGPVIGCHSGPGAIGVGFYKPIA